MPDIKISEVARLTARSTICKSAYPGSIPGVASNIPKQKQREAKKLDAQFA